jgi:thiamine biosynthesis lipoprotein
VNKARLPYNVNFFTQAAALVVLGEEKGPALAESLGLAAYFIVREGEGLRELATPAFDHGL